MRTRDLLFVVLAVIAPFIFASCGVDQSDPKSVADAAIKYQSEYDYKGMITLVNPDDKNVIERFERFQTIRDKMKEDGSAKEDKKYNYEFKSIKDGYTPDEKTVVYSYYDSEYSGGFKFDKSVELKRTDGKWYLKSIK